MYQENIWNNEYQNINVARLQWLTSVILATQEAEIGGSWFKASLGKWFVIPYLEHTQHKNG
jgi:hypothetical protein